MMIDVTEHIGLACYIAKKVYEKYKNKYDLEELVQVAYIGLVKAGNKFDKARGFKFTTYAAATISGELKRFVQDDKRYNIRRGVSHNFIMASYEAERENGSLESRIGTNSFEEDFIARDTLQQAINNLSQEEKRILKLYFFEEKTQKEIGEICDIFQNQVSRIKKRIIKKLRESMGIDMNMKVSV